MIEFRFAHALMASAVLSLAACGGGDDAPAAGGAGSGAGGTLTLSSAMPAVHNTTVDLSTAASKDNMARAADVFSAAPYCEVFWEAANGANGRKYALQVYFRQSDKAALHVSVMEATATGPAPWVAFQNNAGHAITGITVDTTARTLSFANKAIAGSNGEAVTLSGTVGFGSNASVPACGA